MKKLKKKGGVGRSKAGEFMLVNREGQAFKVGRMVVAFWEMCDGTVTTEDLAKEISQKTKREESMMREVIGRIVEDMEKVGLMEYVE